MKRVLSLWGPVVLWCGVIFAMSSIPHLDSGLSYDYPLRKLAHMTEYAILYLLARRPLSPRAAAALSVAYACTDEWHQTFVPGRLGAPVDVLIDSAGVALAALTFRR